MKFQREGAHLGQRDVVKLFYVFADSKTQNIYNVLYTTPSSYFK